MQSAFPDTAWSVWEPLIEEVRPKGKTPPKNLRRTISAIFWRHQNGAKWRAPPSEFGPWWIAAQLFIRWSKLGVWQRLFEKVKDRRQALGMVFLDGTTIRAHHKAAGVAKKGDTEDASGNREAPGRSRGGFGTKVCVAADGHGRALSFTLSPGQAHELPSAYSLLDDLPYPPTYVVCDREYASHKFREYLWNRGSRPVIPPRKNDLEVACPKWAYRHWHLVKNLWARLKEWQAVATRYEKTAVSFLSVILIAATADYIKP
ncbi:IS5 family transposase [Komagataeibacter medellinensis]|uniref:IS5 family transposase n=1 Tax=Komagataeibacter medellinensis TaxID=1177712 RepID=A0ABQ6VYS6_9PROT|nr:IS5 family transposase [Komagataeibacter medellinensis]KAB8125347.1 IS5 family transposase [Komagataeibacter medellinensis]